MSEGKIEDRLNSLLDNIEGKIEDFVDVKELVKNLEHEEVLDVLKTIKGVEKSMSTLSTTVNELSSTIVDLSAIVMKMQVELEDLLKLREKGRNFVIVSRLLLWILGGIVGAILYFKDGILFFLDLFRHQSKI
jgi:hypothetical protein